MRPEIEAVQTKMAEHGMDAYLVPTADSHGSEYVNDFFKVREYLSGFTGSAGTLLITRDSAFLWADGRYHLQAEQQLMGSGIILMKDGLPETKPLEEFLFEKFPKGSVLGFDGKVVSAASWEKYKEHFEIKSDFDIGGDLWELRPEIVPSRIYSLPKEVTGESRGEKLSRVREKMKELGCDYHLISDLMETAWLFNLRGDDIEHTPVFYSYALITMESAKLYVMDEEFDMGIGAEILPYARIYDDLAKLTEGRMLLDKKKTNSRIVRSLPFFVEVTDEPDPIDMMKAIKNKTELEAIYSAHVKDGVAMVNLIAWLKDSVKRELLSEISISDQAEEFRSMQEGFKDISFETICGYMDNGAIIHYAPTQESNKIVRNEGIILIDSGGHYNDGTTDITRTISLGHVTEDMRKHYTLVLKSHIALATAKFPPGTTGKALDDHTRAPLVSRGLNYNHGTGHGVGHLLAVHEGPQNISPKGGSTALAPGMVTSNEPGLYFPGKYGIRLENEILCVKSGENELCFHTMTFCPYDRALILVGYLSKEELHWINDYHARVYKVLAPKLSGLALEYLKEATRPL